MSAIDKSDWPPGPWMSEPDRVEFEAHGFPCLIVRQPRRGHLCGYIAVPPGHPWHGKETSATWEMSIEVHGGITYAEACRDDVCHVPKPGEPDDVWWLGFDCAHYEDLSPARDIELKKLATKSLGGFLDDAWTTYRSVDYVRSQCQRLAAQAKEAAR